MSATHILNVAGGIKCGQLQVRGFVTLHEYLKLQAAGKLRTRNRSSVKHNCSYRRGLMCYGPRKDSEVNCPRRRETVSGFCRECTGR